MPVARKMEVPRGHNFSTCYMELCRQQHLRPLPVICVSLPHSLDFTTDRVKMDDWAPILNSLALDRALSSIGIRSRYQSRKPIEEITSENKARSIGKAPVVLTRFILERLSQSVAQCVRNSPTLVCLELDGIPLPLDCLAVLCVGLSGTQNLRHLSLQRCHIGDDGCELICRTITNARSIRSLNLSQCDLSSRCGGCLATALSRQKLTLYHDAWTQSLRYRQPNLDAMPGLRRLTLNGNPRLGDSAINKVIEAVGDSLWIKALDLQNCGLTNTIADEVLRLLERNTTLIVVDVRLNPGLREELVHEVMDKLDGNNVNGMKSEYRWLGLPRNKITGVSSAHCLIKSKLDDSTVVARPKTAFPQQTKQRTRQPIPARRTPPTPVPVVAKRTKTKSKPVYDVPKKEQPVEDVLKPSLHVDLQSQIHPEVDVADDTKERLSAEVQRAELEKETVTNGTPMTVEEEEAKIVTKDSMLAQELERLTAEHERLLDQSRRTSYLLNEEKSRRELAEAKLLSMKHSLTELEDALKEKEQETSGFLLVSQKFLDEICESFDQLLDMLDDLTRNPSANRLESEEDVIVREDIRRRVDFLIRKTKSENLKRGHFQETSSPKKELLRKMTKSESDIRASLPSVRLERNIGDSPDIVSPLLESSTRESDRKSVPTSKERARAIFTRIINGGVANTLPFVPQSSFPGTKTSLDSVIFT